jgi:hypothetical protein
LKYLAILITLFIFTAGCQETQFNPLEKAKKKDKKKYKGPSSVHYNFSQYVYDEETHKAKVVIKGKIARFFKKKNTVELVNVTLIYNKSGERKKPNKKKNNRKLKITRMTCDEMTIFQQKKLYVGRGDVVVISRNGVRLETNKIYYDEKNNKLYTDKDEKVYIYHKNGSITRGYYLRSDIGMEKIMLDTQKTVTPDDEKTRQKHME